MTATTQEVTKRRPGLFGWLIIAVFAAIWDYFCDDSLSAAFYRTSRSKVGRPIVVTTWAITTLHLFKKLPPKADPYAYIGRIHKK
jgi:hypothetical protein